MKTNEIRELSLSDLRARKLALNDEAFHLRLQQQSGQLEKPSQLRSIRREIARIETFITQKSLSATAGAK